MKLLDVNLLIYAVDEHSARFARAHPWVEGVLGGRETVAFPWSVLLAFLRLTTKRASGSNGAVLSGLR